MQDRLEHHKPKKTMQNEALKLQYFEITNVKRWEPDIQDIYTT